VLVYGEKQAPSIGTVPEWIGRWTRLALPLLKPQDASHDNTALETVSGLVEHINARGTGIKVAGRWLNVSQYYALVELPKLVSECRSTSS